MGLQLAGGAPVVIGLRAGTGRVRAYHRGLSTELPLEVRGPSIVGLRLDSPESLEVGAPTPVAVFAQLADGTETEVSASLSIDHPSIAEIVNRSAVRGLAAGRTRIRARFFDFVAEAVLRVDPRLPPFIRRVIPDRFEPGDPAQWALIEGTDFVAGDTVHINGTPVQTELAFGSTLGLRFFVPVAMLERPDRLDVTVEGYGAVSNTVTVPIGGAPELDRLLPATVVPGHTVRVRAMGRELFGLVPRVPAGWVVDDLTVSDDGQTLELDVTVPATATPASGMPLRLQNGMGEVEAPVAVVTVGPAFAAGAGATAVPSGTRVVSRLEVGVDRLLTAADSDEPLVFLVAGDVVIDGTVDVSGLEGRSHPPLGGDGGPGGGGGGAGGSEPHPDAAPGAGAPPGAPSTRGSCASCPLSGGDGGGRGGGRGSSYCYRALGGAAWGPHGASLHGTSGWSDWGAGTGGGGAGSCADWIDGTVISGSGGGGGGGGGLLEIQVLDGSTLTIAGTLRARGGHGGDGFLASGGGGGGGGSIRLRARGGRVELSSTATLDASGGDGGAPG